MLLYIIAKLFLACKLGLVCICLKNTGITWGNCFYFHVKATILRGWKR